MYYLHHTHAASASTQASLVELEGRRYICSVQHTSLSFQPLDDSAALTLPLNARIIKVVQCRGVLLILTDHHQPRIIAVSRQHGQWKTRAVVQVDELGRQPAETGITLDIDDAAGLLLAHTHAGVLKVVPLDSKQGGAEGDDVDEEQVASLHQDDLEPGLPRSSSAFTVRTPHPHLISSLFLDAARPTLALLSLSSIPSRLPGLGMQCLPVLSFHRLDAKDQELKPAPWGPSPKPLPSATSPSTSTTGKGAATAAAGEAGSRKKTDEGDEERMPGSFGQAGGAREDAQPSTSSRGRGPSAMGATRSAEEERAAEQALAASSLARAHVPLPYADALGAHLLVGLPARAGGGVLVFCETSILLVPPPPQVPQRRDTPKSPTGHAAAAAAAAAPSGAGAAGKRRKASGSEAKGGMQRRTSASSSAFSTSPSSSAMLATSPTTGRELCTSSGKRRRSAAGSSSKEPAAEEGAANAATATALSPTSPTSARRRSSASTSAAAAAVGAPRILRAGIDRPVMVAAASVIKEPLPAASSEDEQDDGVRINADGSAKLFVLFGTRAGRLDLLTISLEQQPQSATINFRPVAMSTKFLGDIPQPGGPHGIAYLGENFVFVASASGDSTLYRLGTDDVLEEVQRWPNLAPILDFVADDGSGGSPSSSKSAQARIITCSGTGPTGSLRVVRNGVAVEDVASLQEPDVRRIWSVADGAGITRLLALGYPSHTRFLALDSVKGTFEDATATFTSAGLGCDEACLLVCGLEDGRHLVHVTEKAVSLVASDTSAVVARWASPAAISCAAATTTGQVLVGTKGAELTLLQVHPGGVEAVATTKLAGEACSIDVTAARGSTAAYAAVALWNPAKVTLLQLPDLNDVSPDALDSHLPSLPRSVLLHTFAVVKGGCDAVPHSPLHLLVGLGDGTLYSFALDLPTESSFSAAILVTERRTASLGTHPLLLRSFVTSRGLHAVFAACDRPTVLFAEGTRLTYSAVKHRDIVDVAQLSTSSTANGGFEGQCLVFAMATELRLTQLGAIQKLDVRTVPLGMDNPLAIAQSAARKALGVATWTFMPEGRQTKIKAGGKVLFFDSETFERLDEYSLQASERPNCVEFMRLANIDEDEGDERELLVVGTGTSLPDRKETTEGRILGFEVSSSARKLKLVFQKVVRGNVFALAQVSRFVAAAINSEVVLYSQQQQGQADDDWPDDDAEGDSRMLGQDEKGDLTERGRWSAAFTAITLSSPQEKLLVVGDALRSLVVLRVNDVAGASKANVLQEMSRDCDPYWTTAAEQIDAGSQTYIGADIAFNLYTSQRLALSDDAQRNRKEAILKNIEAGQTPDEDDVLQHSDGWSRIMERRGAYHYGDLVNKFRRASLVGSASSRTGRTHDIDPRLVFVTAAGAIGVIASLGEREGHIATQVERNLNDFIEPIGGISAEDWRMLRTDHRVSSSAGFIDGDLLARFSSLNKRDKDTVLSGPKSAMAKVDADAAQVGSLVEALARLS